MDADSEQRSSTAQLRGSYWITRAVFLRALGLIYFVAFLSLSQQLVPLIGADGVLPAPHFLDSQATLYGGKLAGFLALPTVFWIDCSDGVMQAFAYAGVGLSLIVLAGRANALLLAALWAIYMSFVHIGQLFYGYGWEILLLETGFLAIFLCPLLDTQTLPPETPPPVLVIWLLRWLLFRVMLGAGLIKLRGDPCWRDLTCMMYHYETQPLPNPLSWYLHQLPAAFHRLEVLYNHLVELVAPWMLFTPRRLRHVAGIGLVLFQLLLILSGNLSWLNWLTLALCVSCFDDQALRWMVPHRVRLAAAQLHEAKPRPFRTVVTYALAALVAYLSIPPVQNLLASHQAMNTSFDRLHLVNTYGAFGSVGKRRYEVILQGTADEELTDSTPWREYEFKCKPGDVARRPCVIAPYQYRIDWQIWFAAMEDYRSNPWLVHFIAELLHGDRNAMSLLAYNPFPQQPPRYIRAELYEYRFTRWSDGSPNWWERQRVATYLPPLAADDPALRRYLRSYGWADGGR